MDVDLIIAEITPWITLIFAVIGLIMVGIQKLQNIRVRDTADKEKLSAELKYNEQLRRLQNENQELVNKLEETESNFISAIDSVKLEMSALSNAVTASQKEYVESNAVKLQEQLDAIKIEAAQQYDNQKLIEEKNAKLEEVKRQLDNIIESV